MSNYIYIMTNRSFEGHNWVKIGLTNNIERRRRSLSNSSLPFPYEVYAYYEIPENNRLADVTLHKLITQLNPNLRLAVNREFFEMTPSEAFDILRAMAIIHNCEDKLHGPTNEERSLIRDNHEQTQDINRHHIRDAEFYCSLTEKRYLATANVNGQLSLIDLSINEEVPNYSTPSKKSILLQTLKDYGDTPDETHTSYQLYRRLAHLILDENRVCNAVSEETNVNIEENSEEHRTTTTLPKLKWMFEQDLIHENEVVYVVGRPNEKAIIVDSQNVSYKGEYCSYRSFVLKVTGWTSVNIYRYLKIEGKDKTLYDLRKERMIELGMIEE